MRWLCFLLASSAAAQAAHGPSAKSLRFDLSAVTATRDSFIYRVRGEERGYAVWQYEIRSLAMGQAVIFTAATELRPAEAEQIRVVLNRLTGEPIASFQRVELFSPTSDTVMVEHDLDVRRGEVAGRRRVGTKDGQVKIVPVSRPLPPGTVWSAYGVYAAHVTNLAPGDSLAARSYSEFGDSLDTLTFEAGQPDTVVVPAGRFPALPITTGGLKLWVTRTTPRRVVKGELFGGILTFELAGTGPVVPSKP